MQSPLHSKSCMLHNQHESFESFFHGCQKNGIVVGKKTSVKHSKQTSYLRKKANKQVSLTKIIYFLPAIKLVFFRKDPDINSIYFVSLAKGE